MVSVVTKALVSLAKRLFIVDETMKVEIEINEEKYEFKPGHNCLVKFSKEYRRKMNMLNTFTLFNMTDIERVNQHLYHGHIEEIYENFLVFPPVVLFIPSADELKEVLINFKKIFIINELHNNDMMTFEGYNAIIRIFKREPLSPQESTQELKEEPNPGPSKLKFEKFDEDPKRILLGLPVNLGQHSASLVPNDSSNMYHTFEKNILGSIKKEKGIGKRTRQLQPESPLRKNPMRKCK